MVGEGGRVEGGHVCLDLHRWLEGEGRLKEGMCTWTFIGSWRGREG